MSEVASSVNVEWVLGRLPVHEAWQNLVWAAEIVLKERERERKREIKAHTQTLTSCFSPNFVMVSSWSGVILAFTTRASLPGPSSGSANSNWSS